MNKAHLTMDHTLTWYCPGCECGHGVPVLGGRAWGWNQSLTAPTLTPSIHVFPHDASPPFKPQPRCHSFITDGKIIFLPDCTHVLAGKTVEMEDD